MRGACGLALTVLVSVGTCAAQFEPCKTSVPFTVGQRDGVIERTVSFLEAGGEVGAHVFAPDSEDAVPGIVFSHSAIHGPTASIDLVRFARALAMSGAASIVLDGMVEWETPNDSSKQPYHLTRCAGYWLLSNVNIAGRRLSQAGPGVWVGNGGYYCLEGEGMCWGPGPSINFGLTSDAEYRNAQAMLTPEGRLRTAQWLQHQLHLRRMKADWFNE